MNKNKAVCQKNTMTMVKILQSLGYTINDKKLSLVPSQRIVFFGFLNDTVQFKKRESIKIMLKAKHLRAKFKVTVRELASFIGLVINAFYCYEPGVTRKK